MERDARQGERERESKQTVASKTYQDQTSTRDHCSSNTAVTYSPW